jgi:hypothetical protein
MNDVAVKSDGWFYLPDPNAGRETGVAVETFPPTCPWTTEHVLATDFWPEGQVKDRVFSSSVTTTRV